MSIIPALAQGMALPDSISVSETGGAIQNFPIAVPPGTAGVVPSLQFTYNSQDRNGIVGMGFMLNGLATIGRCPRTFAQDGVRGGGVNFDANDRFCLDGQRLMAVSGAYGADGTEYRTEIESFTKVISRGSAGTGPAWFEVRTKSGQIMEFGNTGDSRILATGKPTARSWAVNKVSDTKGNYFTITYVNDTANGQAYPSRIDYTGNSGAGLAPYNSVRFVYNTARPDVITAYHAGSFSRTTVLLTNVQTYAGSNLVSDYRLTYNTGPATGRMRLRTITLCDGAGTCLPVTTIGWTAGTAPQTFTRSTVPAASAMPDKYRVFSSGDFNGDGLTDLYLNHAYDEGRAAGLPDYNLGGQVWLSKGDGTFNRLTVPAASAMPDKYRVFSSGDFNGDGLTDLYLNHAYDDGRAAGLPDYNLGGQVWLSKGDGTFNRLTVPAASAMPDEYLAFSTGDFNGDGLTDLYLAHAQPDGRGDADAPGQVWLAKGDGTFNRLVLTVSDSVPNDYSVYSSGDFNGDGLTDLYLAHAQPDGRGDADAPGQVWLAKGDGTFNRRVLTVSDSVPDDYSVYSSGDFNGDGLTDLYLAHAQPDGRGDADAPGQVWLAKGDGTFNRLVLTVSDSVPDDYRVYSSGDFNGDGLTDIYLNHAYNNGRAAGLPAYNLGGQVWLSKGGGTFNRSIIPAANAIPDKYLAFSGGDFNGDGLADLYLNHAYDDGRAAGLPDYNLGGQVWISPGPVPDILLSVTDGLGAQTTITYKPMTTSSVYTKDSGANRASYPVLDVQGPMQVTSRLERSDGVGGMRVSTYRYAGAKMDLTGRGFLGFREMTARDEQTAIEQKSVYEQYYPLTLLKKSDTRSLNVLVLSSQTNSYTAANLGGTRRQVTLSQTQATGTDLNGTALPSMTSTYQYDSYSNATQIAVTASDGYSKTTINTYTNDAAKWLLGRLNTATVTSTAP